MKIIQFTTDNREQQKDYANPSPHFGAAPEALLEGLACLAGIEVHVVSCVRREVTQPTKIFGNIYYHPVMVPKIGWMSTLYSGCIRATSRMVREIAPDIVHGQGCERDCAMNAVHCGKPNVITIHGNMAELQRLGETFESARLYGFLASKMESHALGKTNGVFCNSGYTENLVSSRTRKTWRVPNAVRSAFFGPPMGHPASDVPQIINVGVICPRKRQLELLRAAGMLHTKGITFRLVFVGHMPTSSYGIQFAEELQKAELAGYAAYAGVLQTSELIQLMDQSHAMIHCPTEESFGLVVAEALARGLKFFGANLGGIRDIASSLDGTVLRDTIEQIMFEVETWISKGANRESFMQNEIKRLYHPIVVAKKHIEIYRSLLTSDAL